MKKRNRFFLTCGVIMFISELFKQLCLTFISNSGTYNWWYFPFQLCSIPMYICLILPFIKHPAISRMFLTFLMDFSLLSGVFTFFDTSGLRYGLSVLTIHSYLWHILLIVIGITAGITSRRCCTFRDFRNCVWLFAGTCLAATALNITLHPYGKINMFYISPYYKMSQIIFCDISRIIGNGAAICIYLSCIITGAALLHLFWHRLLSHNV